VAHGPALDPPDGWGEMRNQGRRPFKRLMIRHACAALFGFFAMDLLMWVTSDPHSEASVEEQESLCIPEKDGDMDPHEQS